MVLLNVRPIRLQVPRRPRRTQDGRRSCPPPPSPARSHCARCAPHSYALRPVFLAAVGPTRPSFDAQVSTVCTRASPSSVNTFYEGDLQNGVTASERQPIDHDFPWPNRARPMFFFTRSARRR